MGENKKKAENSIILPDSHWPFQAYHSTTFHLQKSDHPTTTSYHRLSLPLRLLHSILSEPSAEVRLLNPYKYSESVPSEWRIGRRQSLEEAVSGRTSLFWPMHGGRSDGDGAFPDGTDRASSLGISKERSGRTENSLLISVSFYHLLVSSLLVKLSQEKQKFGQRFPGKNEYGSPGLEAKIGEFKFSYFRSKTQNTVIASCWFENEAFRSSVITQRRSDKVINW